MTPSYGKPRVYSNSSGQTGKTNTNAGALLLMTLKLLHLPAHAAYSELIKLRAEAKTCQQRWPASHGTTYQLAGAPGPLDQSFSIPVQRHF